MPATSDLTLDTLRAKNKARAIEWHNGDKDGSTSLEFKAMELGGEVGEVLNACKKLARWHNQMRGGVDPITSKKAIAEELADVLICVDLLAMELDIDLSEATVAKFNATSDKMHLETRLND